MTIDDARALVDDVRRKGHVVGGILVHDGEGYLDTLARLERDGGLTPELKEAGDVIWLDSVADLEGLAETMRKTGVTVREATDAWVAAFAADSHSTDTVDAYRVGQSRPK